MSIELLVIALSALMVFWVWRSHETLSNSLENPSITGKPKKYPMLSVIRPIKGMDTDARKNIAAALNPGYKGELETIFVFDNDSEPAFPIVKEEIIKHEIQKGSSNAKVVFSGEPPNGRTGKLNAMIAGLKEAKGGLIVFADSDIRPKNGAINKLVETLLSTPGAGSAFAPVIATGDIKTLGDAGYALMLNGFYAPAAAHTARKNFYKLSFIMGQFMVFKREAITAIGGLENAEGQLVDDMYLGERITQAGYTNVVAPISIPIIEEALSLQDFRQLFIKWIAFSRTGLSGWHFKFPLWLKGLAFWLGLVVCAYSFSSGRWLGGIAATLAPLSVAASINILHRLVGGSKITVKHLWVSFGIILAAPIVYLNTFFRRKVNWRGRDYKLNSQAKLAVNKPVIILEAARPKPQTYPYVERRYSWVYVPPELDRRRARAAQ